MTPRKRSDITADTPLRLADAIKIAFLIEKIAGKEFTTLAHIERMRQLCRVEARAPDSTSKPSGETKPEASHIEPPGSSATTVGMSAQAALQMRLRLQSKS